MNSDKAKIDLERFENDDVYYGDSEYVTNSMLGKLKRSPKHLAHYLKYGSGSSQALDFGRAFHLCILEEEKFSKEVALYQGRRAGKEWVEFKNNHKEFLIINQTEFDTLRRMRDSIISNQIARDLIANCKKEVPMVWQDEETGVWCKGKADGVADDYLLDLKTTREPNLDNFKRSAMKYGYDRQSAFYLDGFKRREFWFICIEKESPNNLVIASCSNEFINKGREDYKDLLMFYKKKFIEQDGNLHLQNSFEIGVL
jgi:hypothetical protein